ncbi:SusC/RagA family TonB-linked outer membrane protein [Butyricimonas synergistica]|uniref:SusC/RagA family TonB-linked outer membrane protein n=1 Tax=Butyricimonas synergistica TaxID=544644 RepID=UPI00036FDC6F|nr:SusC/RagA family TonB-linked outer membrane protein [Butyricimonas synergistica]
MIVNFVIKFEKLFRTFYPVLLITCCVCLFHLPGFGSTRPDKIIVLGEVKGEDGEPLPGVSVVVKGTSWGCVTDKEGKFKLEIPDKEAVVLVFKHVGMKTRELRVPANRLLTVVMTEDTKELDDVIVTAYYTLPKNAFTGEITTLRGEDLLKVSPNNIIQALATLVPGLRIVENNEQGSNPNAVPEILIRGASSLMLNDQSGVNAPLVMLDGVKITIEELYDLDIHDVERVDVLKDASAAVLYGEKAANGVILIERTRVKGSKTRFNYSFTPIFNFPDLNSLHLCNAEQKLELERLAGLYDKADGSLYPSYAYKLENVRRGIDTDWASKPLRNAFTHGHAVSLTGRGGNIEYRASGRFTDVYGVMKGDYRKNYGISFSLGYRLQQKLLITYRFTYSMTDSKNSPYGSFVQYALMNPYNPVYDENGKYIRNYEFYAVGGKGNKQQNPLYNASLSSFSKKRGKNITNYLSVRWDVFKSLFVSGDLSVSQRDSRNKVYVSPENSRFEDEVLDNKKGTYTETNGESTDWSAKLALNYRVVLSEAGTTVFSLSAGTDIGKDKSSTSQLKAEGFMKDKMSDLKFAAQYATTRPLGGEKESAEVGFFVNGSFDLLGRYFVNGSYKSSGSSKFGSKHRFAPVWSAGIGWNLHEESFMNFDWLNVLRLRFSVGSTANVTFSPYQAMTTYLYDNDLLHYGGIGAVPITMGNPDMKWQITNKYNWGLTAVLWNERVNVSASYYVEKTEDALMPLSLPSSVGVSDVQVNMGRLQNSGYEFSVLVEVLKKNNLLWMVMVNGSHVIDKLTKISDALRAQNLAAYYGVKPQPMFVEGGSQFGIYAMRSAGIDPATGQEVYIKKNGHYTFDYNADERVEVGNTNPKLEGSIFTSLEYKGFSLNVSAAYRFGGDIYNTTLANKVEYIDPHNNVDRRAFTERWKEPGDLVRFLGIPEEVTDDNRYSERFVERDNLLEITSIMLSYEWRAKWLKKLGLQRLNVGFGMSDIARISSVKLERGTEYPFQRGFNLTLKTTF